jgi:regulator of ribonuclease activity A
MPHTASTPMFATTDLCDAHEERLIAGELRVLHPAFRAFGKRARFAGAVATVRCFEDNSMVRAVLETPGNGRVLVVDGGGSLRCALLGGNLAKLACDNGWVGVVVNGCVRDVAEINGHDVGVRALATHPRRSDRRGSGARDQVVEIAGVRVAPGDWCYADDDGILISDDRLEGA